MSECKTEKHNSQLEHGQPMEQTSGLFCMCDSGVAHNTSVTSGEWVRCSKRIARASELGSCQSNLCNSWGYERLQKSKDSLKDCFENVNIWKMNPLTGTALTSSNQSMACIKTLAVGTGVGSLGGISSEESSGCGVPRWLPRRYSLLGRDKLLSDLLRPRKWKQ